MDASLRGGVRSALVTHESLPAEPIRVWPFSAALADYQLLSDHGGDEDWVALVPPGLDPSWAWEGTSFGCCSVSEHEVGQGWRILIGAHA